MRRRRRRAIAAAAVALVAAAAAGAMALPACGGDDGGALPSIVYEADNGSATNVYKVDPQTREATQLTRSGGYDGQPAWTPGHERIIFVSDRDAASNITDLYTMAPDGSDVRRLTSTPESNERSPKFSPDGSRIAIALVRDTQYYVATLAPDGSDEQILAGPFRFVEFPSWTRDGKDIYFAAIGEETQQIDILSVSVASKEVTVRVSTPSPDVCPHFSFDGKYMTYARSPQGPNDEPDLFRRSIESTDVSGASDEQLTDDLEARDDYANPSPDDRQYVFLSNRDGNFDLYLMDRDGTNLRRLTDTPELRENVPDW